jgi:thiol-disulfide isomerase/thioredoxin
MKKILTSITTIIATGSLFAQVGVVAPDFTQTDINGTSHNLYTYLNAGKVVIVDMSATWCGPCWGFHNAHYLESLHDEFGPGGTNEVVVLFYEDDTQTTLADLNGTGSNTQGDWVTGVTYPIINGTASLPYPEYGEGYPTVSVICPTDKKIKDNLFGYGTLNEMRAAVQDIIDQCSSAASLTENTALEVSVAPNPTTGNTTVRFSVPTDATATIELYSVSGQYIFAVQKTIASGENSVDLDLSTLDAGTYFIKVMNEDSSSTMIPVVKR